MNNVQVLRLPINIDYMTAGYKNSKYRTQFGFSHYGQDHINVNKNRTVYSPGTGKIIAIGNDGYTKGFGNVIVLQFDNVYNHYTKKVSSVICRMYHFDSLSTSLKKGQTVTPDTYIGKYGSTGRYANAAHLHIEFDSDIKNPLYVYGWGGGGSILKPGTIDSTINPSQLLTIKKTAPDNQTLSGDKNYCSTFELNMPSYSSIVESIAPDTEEETVLTLESLNKSLEELKKMVEENTKKINAQDSRIKNLETKSTK